MTHTALILLVEDNPQDVELTLDAFRRASFNNPIHVVGTPAVALTPPEPAANSACAGRVL